MNDWDNGRCAELEMFESLLRELSSINSGSHCLERIARCIELGGKLSSFDLSARINFKQFLHALAIADRGRHHE